MKRKAGVVLLFTIVAIIVVALMLIPYEVKQAAVWESADGRKGNGEVIIRIRFGDYSLLGFGLAPNGSMQIEYSTAGNTVEREYSFTSKPVLLEGQDGYCMQASAYSEEQKGFIVGELCFDRRLKNLAFKEQNLGYLWTSGNDADKLKGFRDFFAVS